MAYGIHCEVDRNEALRYLGYAGQALDPSLEQRLDEALCACGAGRNPAGTFSLFPLEREDAGIRVAGTGVVLAGEDIARFLQDATHCALMAVTLGAERERELARRSALSPADALLFDAACSALAEAAVEALHAQVCSAAAACGMELLPGRFSPGYGDLPLSVQRPLLAAVDAFRRIGLAATEDNLLVPRKSVTAVVGLRKASDAGAAATAASAGRGADDAPSPCDTCNLAEQCAFRREERTCYDR